MMSRLLFDFQFKLFKKEYIHSLNVAILFMFFQYNFIWGQTTVTFTNTASATTWTVPAGVTTVTINCWGGGGGGGSVKASTTGLDQTGGGGGGGACSVISASVTSGDVLTITVGLGGTAGTNGGNGGNGGTSSVVTATTSTLSSANGGNGGAGKSGSSSGNGTGGTGGSTGTGTIKAGGSGAGGFTGSSFDVGGGGGGAGGTTNAGGNATIASGSGTTASSGGTGGATGGGNGANGTAGSSGNNARAGVAGTVPGGGGSGAAAWSTTTNYNGGAGARGEVSITYIASPSITVSGTLNAFTSCLNTESSSQTFTVSGTNMTAGITITPPVGFEVSTASSFTTIGTNATPITVGAAGTIASTTIYVRMSSQGSSPASGNIACSSSGATTQNVAVSGTVSTTIVWTDANNGNAFYTNINWTPNWTSSNWKTCNVAQFDNAGTASSYGINMATSALSIAAIDVTSSRTTNSITIGNSSTTAGGNLTLNGATLNSISNTILRNASSQLLTIQNTQGSGTQTMGLVLANATSNINIESSGGITISSIISGANPITKIGSGSGSLTLSGANTFSGATNINAGTLKLGVSSTSSTSGPLGTNAGGAIISSGAVLDLNGFSLTSSATESLTLNGTGISNSGALINTSGTASTWAGTVSIASDAGVGGSGDITLSGVISGANSLSKYGTSTLTLSNTNTFGGAGKTFSIDNGTVIISSFANNFGNSSNTFSIGSTSTGATLKFSSATGTVSRIFSIGSSGGTMENTSTGTVTFDQNATLNGELTANISGASGNIIYSGILSGAGSLKVNSITTTQVVRLNAVNTYSGSTTITAGILRIGVANAIPSSSNVIMNGGTLSNNSTNFGFTTSGILNLSSNSVFELGSSGNFTFGASNLTSWTAGSILTITGWTGNPGASGTGARIFVGSNPTSLTDTQLDQINFDGFSSGAMMLSTGEVVPKLYQYRTKQTGNWNLASTWEKSSDGTNWSIATSSPTYLDATITIRNTHTVTVTGSVAIDQTTIETGGTLNLNSAVTLTLNNGTGTDVDLYGTFIQSAGTLTNNGQIVVQNGGLFRQAKVGTVIPTATWNNGSTCEVTGWTTTFGGGIDQAFSNFTWNCASQTSTTMALEPTTMSVSDLFKVESTGIGKLSLLNSGGINRSLTVGNFEITGGQFNLSGTNGDGTSTLTVSNNFLISGGLFYFQDNPTVSAGVCRLIIGGNMTISGGNVSTDTFAGNIGIYFNGTSTQTYTHSGGTLLDYLSTRFGYKTTSGPSSINEIYSHSSIAQTTINGTTMSNFTGYASWPTSGSLINNLTINNPNGVTLSTAKTVNGNLNLTNGILTTTSSNLLYIANTSTTAINGGGPSAYVSGPLKWAVTNSGGTYMYQIGKNGKYAPAGITEPTLGSTDFMAEYFNADPNTVNYTRASKEGTINNVSACEYWMIDKPAGSASAKVILSWDTLTRSCRVRQPSDLLVLRWSGTQWTNLGNQSTSGGINTGTVTASSSINTFSPFTLGSTGNLNPLPVSLLNFNANCINKNVKLNWQTASEINNDYFDVERSADGNSYTSLLRINGNGTTSEPQQYITYVEQPNIGSNYYRLKQVDFNGRTTYYNPIVVNCHQTEGIILYPNPNNGSFVVSGLNENEEIQLTDALGKTILSKKGEINYEVNNLQEGIYFVIIKNKFGLVQTQKIVVQR